MIPACAIFRRREKQAHLGMNSFIFVGFGLGKSKQHRNTFAAKASEKLIELSEKGSWD
jgi:hypothetical protein